MLIITSYLFSMNLNITVSHYLFPLLCCWFLFICTIYDSHLYSCRKETLHSNEFFIDPEKRPHGSSLGKEPRVGTQGTKYVYKLFCILKKNQVVFLKGFSWFQYCYVTSLTAVEYTCTLSSTAVVDSFVEFTLLYILLCHRIETVISF